VSSISKALRWQFDGIERAGPDLLISLVPHSG
jgi:diaminohydroxyphosphoribosylaminopyrimidine deaminase / 5-amino-6-(5-phosphoribosylamino)uracil reductase